MLERIIAHYVFAGLISAMLVCRMKYVEINLEGFPVVRVDIRVWMINTPLILRLPPTYYACGGSRNTRSKNIVSCYLTTQSRQVEPATDVTCK